MRYGRIFEGSPVGRRGIAGVAVALMVSVLAVGVHAPKAGAVVPPGFDNGNQTSNPLVKRASNVDFMSLATVSPAISPIVATDDVVGPHGPSDPAALQAFSGLAENGFDPADTYIAAGSSFVVEMINSDIAVFDRAGALKRAVKLSAMFSDPAVGDGRVVFDPMPAPGHWVISDMDITGGADAGDAIDVAVSHSADPTGQWDVYRAFSAPSDRFADEPRLGFSADKVLIEFTSQDKLTFPSFCATCWDDIMIVIEKSDLDSFASSPQAIDINLSTELNHRFGVIPATPLPGAEVPNAFAVYRGHDILGAYASTLVIVGLPSTNDVAFKETGPKIADTSPPPAASQPGVTPANIDPGDDMVMSVSLVSASNTDFSGTLWTAGGDKCKPQGSSVDRACARIDKITVDASGNATVPNGFDFELGLNNEDIMYPAVVGDPLNNRVWVADSRTGSTFPTSELRLLDFNTIPPKMHTISYGSGKFAYTIDTDPGHDGLSRFGDYSGIFVDPAEPSGATVWAATENAATSSGGGFTTSIVEATTLKPDPVVSPSSGFAGDTVDITGHAFSRESAVRFGAVPSPKVTFLGSDHLRAVVPAQPPTTVDVFVTTVKGTSDAVPSDQFTYKWLLWSSGIDIGGANAVAVDPNTGARIAEVKVPTGSTQGIALSPDGRTLYETSPVGGTLLWIDTTTRAAVGTDALGGEPTEIAISTDGKTAFVTDPTLFKGSGGVLVLNLATKTGIPAVKAKVSIPDPRGVATTANGEAWVTSGTTKTVFGMTLSPCPLIKRWCPTFAFPVPNATPGPIAAGPDRLWVGAQGDPTIAPGVVYPIDPAIPALGSPLFLDRVPTAMAASPDGQWAFAIASDPGVALPVHHAPPAPDTVLPEFALPDGPLQGGAVSFDSQHFFVAGDSSGVINAAVVPGAYTGPLVGAPTESLELATNLPPKDSCDGATWGSPASSVAANQSVPTAGAYISVTASLLYCPPPLSAGGTATLDLTVTPPKTCAKKYHESATAVPLTAGPVAFTFQFQATCTGTWHAKPAILNYIGGGSPPPIFKTASVAVS